MELAVTQYNKKEIWLKYTAWKIMACIVESIVNMREEYILFNKFMNTCVKNACSDVGDINVGFLFFVSWNIKWFTMNVRLYDLTSSMELKFNISNTKVHYT